MVGQSIEQKILSLLRTRAEKKRKIIFGLKSDNFGREMLLRLLAVVVKPGEKVLAIHVQEPFDSFDPNTFHIHEDLCKSKQVDFQVKVCSGDSYISELSHQARVNYATVLALGCSPSGPKEPGVHDTCLKLLPPTCSLLVMDNAGRIVLQRQGTSQQGSNHVFLRSSVSSPVGKSCSSAPTTTRQLKKSLTSPSFSTPVLVKQGNTTARYRVQKTVQVPNFLQNKLIRGLALTAGQESSRHFTLGELNLATNNFSPEMVIGEGGHGKVYRANLQDGRAAAVKVVKNKKFSVDDLVGEVEILSSIKHENIIQIIGCCVSNEMHAIVYNLMQGSLKQKLGTLKWSERMGVAIGLAKALDYLHHSFNPPVIHRDVKSSNVLLSDNCQPQLSDFGAAIVYRQPEKNSADKKPFNVVGTFGYLAPEYVMYGKVDEKVDVYSYGVVLLELISGREAIHVNQENHESLVLWARSLLCSGLFDRLIDPHLNQEYRKEEMETMVLAARLCHIHSSSRRPSMKMILRLFQEPEYWLQMQREKEEFLNGISFNEETSLWRQEDLVVTSHGSKSADDFGKETMLPEAPDC